jgi:hypothetical protein
VAVLCCSTVGWSKRLTSLQMNNRSMSTSNSYTVSEMEMVGLLWWNTGHDVHFAGLHVAKYSYTAVLWGTLQNVKNNGRDKTMFWQQCSEAQLPLKYAEFPGRTVWHKHRHGEFCIIVVSTRYHLQRVQPLPVDHANRVWFCESLQPWLQILPDILFMDEAQFSRNNITNTTNSHSWTQENPHEVRWCYFKHPFSVDVWCGVLRNNLVEPHVIARHLKAPYYGNFL